MQQNITNKPLKQIISCCLKWSILMHTSDNHQTKRENFYNYIIAPHVKQYLHSTCHEQMQIFILKFNRLNSNRETAELTVMFVQLNLLSNVNK